MTIEVVIAVIGVLIPVVLYFSNRKDQDKKELRKISNEILVKLTKEITLIESGRYPFQTLNRQDFDKLLALTPERKIKKLKLAIESYKRAHDGTVKIQHYHDTHPSDYVFFLNSFDVINPEETIKDLELLRKFLKKI
ncbi:hypothetical protein [Xenorhabdus bovienii]|uniref:hypothetical protein n=1 Tax=Xenorhabdus bovienii TaxID=40576 RepID=UPI00237D196E|nr:hypothetical protein [Xenorhabdus bovienii]MDE1474094.1 hypothetical protein [Xenorhabdus bovienii]MDE9457511.1 hypothetical protein [Xenorhabdus bovienii]MDE9487641.1 hypothetical protein [Xenorhabdus bovienii]MDE9514389.1 hypothetical protein [Xenorhabdus bovienii]